MHALLRAAAGHQLVISFLFVLCVCQSAAAGDAPASVPHVGVVVRNFSDASAEVIQSAEAACERIFGNAGVRITWFNTLDQVKWRGPDLVLEAAILRQAPASRSSATFGTAVREKQTLLIYHDRVVGFSKLLEMPEYHVLALALVHEAGHLLLDSDEHTRAGIMRAEWAKADVTSIGQGQLRFTLDQSQRMKLNVQTNRRANSR